MPQQASFASVTTPVLSASPGQTRFGHRSRLSTESSASNTAHYGSGVPVDAARVEDMLSSSRAHDGRARQSPLESGDRSAGPEPSHWTKDPKSRLGLGFLRKKKPREDGTSPEEVESPLSFASRAAQVGDPHLPSPSGETPAKHLRSTRIYVLATMDYWNYRMCDVTGANTATDIRRDVCVNLGLNDYPHSIFYRTELGTFDHNEPLDDQKLLSTKRTHADTVGSLKFFVRQGSPSTAATSAFLTPDYASNRNGLDEEAYERLNGRQRSSSSPPSSRANTGTADEGEKALAQDSTDYKSEIERQQRGYITRKMVNKKDSPTIPEAATGYGIVGSRRVDFDQPRESPFEDKKVDHFLPQRRAPAPPSDPSVTQRKADSLRRKSGSSSRSAAGPDMPPPPQRQVSGSDDPADRGRKGVAPIQPEEGIGAALAGIGRNLGAVGQSTANTPKLRPMVRSVSSSDGVPKQGKEPIPPFFNSGTLASGRQCDLLYRGVLSRCVC